MPGITCLPQTSEAVHPYPKRPGHGRQQSAVRDGAVTSLGCTSRPLRRVRTGGQRQEPACGSPSVGAPQHPSGFGGRASSPGCWRQSGPGGGCGAAAGRQVAAALQAARREGTGQEGRGGRAASTAVYWGAGEATPLLLGSV